MRLRFALIPALAFLLLPAQALASQCHAFVQDAPGARYAALGPVAQAAEPVRISFVGHSTYRIETAGGVIAATDYFGTHGGGPWPDIVTMNHAHETHFTDYPDPAIGHVLRGWNPAGDGPAEHLLEIRDLVVRNVTTDIRGWGLPEKDGNSIFIFEVAGLCIGHLGHLHHEPDDMQYALIGQLDIVMAPVDGTFTLDLPAMLRVLKRLKARIVLPMHAFGAGTLARFLDGMSDAFAIRRLGGRDLVISADTMPEQPVVMLPRGLAFDPGE